MELAETLNQLAQAKAEHDDAKNKAIELFIETYARAVLEDDKSAILQLFALIPEGMTIKDMLSRTIDKMRLV